ncbi:hypothetical protein M405DRAFT_846618 [Rhizopogon salebrosus TDB-379]|nr:hypothetical protein M405DRAFT_846618 [Rhizopogon salebrosus TDB-379]
MRGRMLALALEFTEKLWRGRKIIREHDNPQQWQATKDARSSGTSEWGTAGGGILLALQVAAQNLCAREWPAQQPSSRLTMMDCRQQRESDLCSHVRNQSYDELAAKKAVAPLATQYDNDFTIREGERAKAEAGEVVQDLDDLCSKLDKRYTDGCSKDTDTYLRIQMEVLGG